MSKLHSNSHAAFLDSTATLAVTALRSLRLAIPLSATLMLSACAGSGLELAAIATADPASGDAASSTPSQTGVSPGSMVTGALEPIEDTARVSRAAARGGADTASATDAAPSPAIAKARGLRANGDLRGAMAVLDGAAKTQPDDAALLRERGLLALELGQIKDAKQLLTKANAAGPADWRIKSALGSAHAADGDQQAAQREFAAALRLAPDHPSILNNLALSYALDGRHDQAEKLLRTAARSKSAEARAKQNLALLLGLHGEIDEARQLSESSLPRDEAKSNISYLQRLKTDGAQVSRARRTPAEASVASSTATGPKDGN